MSVTVRRIARKTHRCDSCNRPTKIQAGDAYLTHTALAGDEFGYHDQGKGDRPRRTTECSECATRYGRADLLVKAVKTLTPAPAAPRVLDIAAAIMVAAARDGIEMFVAKLHFLCYQVQGWTLVSSGQPAFSETIHATAEGVRIEEISVAYAVFGENTFTLQDAIDAGVITIEDPPADDNCVGEKIIQR